MTFENADGVFVETGALGVVCDKVVKDFDPTLYEALSCVAHQSHKYLRLRQGCGVHIVGIAINEWSYGYDASDATSLGWFPTSHVSFRCHGRFHFNAK